VVIRPATRADARAIASLHATRIAEGYLTSLGPRFLTRLYERVVAAPDAFAYVALRDGRVVGFVAVALDLGAFARRFLLRDGLPAGASAAPRLLRSIPRVLETLRYPAATGTLPDAEVLAVAVAGDASRAGLGRALVAHALGDLAARRVPDVKVVTGADNAAAVSMYEACGFQVAERREVHRGVASLVLVARVATPARKPVEVHA
jgi:ribosomal protein S18 acetylase RimI-like enzyme